MGCGAPEQGKKLEDVTTSTSETVIEGRVTVAGTPVPSAYVRLLDGTGEFTAEVVTSPEGQFRFFAAPGDWRLRALSSLGSGEVAVAAEQGVNEAELSLSS